MPNGAPTPCEIAIQRYEEIARWRNLWTILLFGFGTVVVAFLVVSILFFFKQSWVAAGLTTLGTITSGTAISWVVARRNEAVSEEDAAYQDVVKQCGSGSTPSLSAIQKRYKLVGRLR